MGLSYYFKAFENFHSIEPFKTFTFENKNLLSKNKEFFRIKYLRDRDNDLLAEWENWFKRKLVVENKFINSNSRYEPFIKVISSLPKRHYVIKITKQHETVSSVYYIYDKIAIKTFLPGWIVYIKATTICALNFYG